MPDAIQDHVGFVNPEYGAPVPLSKTPYIRLTDHLSHEREASAGRCRHHFQCLEQALAILFRDRRQLSHHVRRNDQRHLELFAYSEQNVNGKFADSELASRD